MVDREEFRKFAKSRKASFSFLSECIGVSRACFCNKLNNKSDFKADELMILSDVLRMDADDRERIFFAK